MHPSGSGFTVQLSALLAGQGSITVANTTMTGDGSVQMNVPGTFEQGKTGDFVEKDCTFDFGGQTGDIGNNPNMGIAPGRIWGNLICPMIVDGQNNETCFAVAEMRFENCAE